MYCWVYCWLSPRKKNPVTSFGVCIYIEYLQVQAENCQNERTKSPALFFQETRCIRCLQQDTMGLNNPVLLHRNEATCENWRPLASNICELFQRQCLQLRRCLVGSPVCRVEALQRLKFPQPVVCGGDIWRENIPSICDWKTTWGSALNVSEAARTHWDLWLIWWDEVP